MLDVSSVGRGQPKFKTINVEANLLAERAREQTHLRAAIRKRVVALVLVTATGATTVPWLYSWQKVKAAKSEKVTAEAREISLQLAQLQAAQESAAPAQLEAQMKQKAASNMASYNNRIVQFLRCAKPGIALVAVQGTLINGDLKLVVRGEAEDFNQYLSYIDRMQSAVGRDGVQPKSTLTGDHVVFELSYASKKESK